VRSASFAEWIIAQFTTKARAAAIIGDLLEAVPQKGKPWFWLSVARVIFSLTWRYPLAYAAAIGAVLCWVRAYRFTVFGRPSDFILSQQWMARYLFVFRANALLSVALAYTAIVYGTKDPFARRIAAVWILFEALVFFGTTPGVAIICVLLAVCAIVYSLSSATERKGLLALATTAALCFGWMKQLATPFLAMPFVGFHAAWKVFLTHDGPYLSPSSRIIMQLVDLFALTLIYSGVHHIFLGKNSRGSTQVSAEIS
jgi:hypothetical protein